MQGQYTSCDFSYSYIWKIAQEQEDYRVFQYTESWNCEFRHFKYSFDMLHVLTTWVKIMNPVQAGGIIKKKPGTQLLVPPEQLGNSNLK